MPQFLRPVSNQYPFLDGSFHGKTMFVRDGLNCAEVVKPRPIRIWLDPLDFDPNDSVLEIQRYNRRIVCFTLHPTKDAKVRKVREFEVFVFEGMNEKDIARELMYMLLRRPADRPLYATV